MTRLMTRLMPTLQSVLFPLLADWLTTSRQGRRKHLRVGQAQSRHALARAQSLIFILYYVFYELSVDDGKIAFFSQKVFWEKRKKGWDETLVPAS